jgi:hypothetical protein
MCPHARPVPGADRVRANDVYEGAQLIARGESDPGADWALVRLARRVVGPRAAPSSAPYSHRRTCWTSFPLGHRVAPITQFRALAEGAHGFTSRCLRHAEAKELWQPRRADRGMFSDSQRPKLRPEGRFRRTR